MDEQSNPTSDTVTTPAAQPSPEPPVVETKPRKSPLLHIVLAVVVLALIAGAAFLGYSTSNSKATKDKSALNSQISSLQADVHVLPADAIKVSDCVPNMGSHYLPKGADPQYGPFILVNKAGKVTGLEYMAAQSMYTPIPQTVPPVELITKNSPLYGWKFDHIEFSHLPKGHEGFMVDHIDVHLFTVSPDQVKQSCV